MGTCKVKEKVLPQFGPGDSTRIVPPMAVTSPAKLQETSKFQLPIDSANHYVPPRPSIQLHEPLTMPNPRPELLIPTLASSSARCCCTSPAALGATRLTKV